jgi:hypothetical protein
MASGSKKHLKEVGMNAHRYLGTRDVEKLNNEAEAGNEVTEDPLVEIRRRLVEAGLDAAYDLSPWIPADALLLCEACNLAAKVVCSTFYELKGAAIDAALQTGCDGGWGEDECFYLSAPGVGVASFHDPCGEIRSQSFWDHEWSGIRRQDLAFQAITRPAVRRLLDEATRPAASLTPAQMYRALNRLAA